MFSSLSRQHLLEALFKALDAFQTRYCVLHSWSNLPRELSSDLDLVIHPGDRARLKVVFEELQQIGYRVIQTCNYAAKSYRFDVGWFDDCQVTIVGIDVIYEYRYAGLIIKSAEDLLRNRTRQGTIWVTASENEFEYLLVKKSLKGSISAAQEQRLKDLIDQIGAAKARDITEGLFGAEWKDQVINACLLGQLHLQLGSLRSRVQKINIGNSPLNLVRYYAAEMHRVVHRFLRPTGLFIVLLGPDGVGKSTLAEQLAKAFAPAFRRVDIFHWRARFFGNANEVKSTPLAQPHAQIGRGALASFCQLLYLWMSFVCGYYFIIRPALVRSRLVIFDRYFHDILVDAKRYRYGGPSWLLRLVARMTPGPDAPFLVLDAPEAVILARKSEVEESELRRQRAAYKNLPASFVSDHIETNQDLKAVTMATSQVVFNYLVARNDRCHAIS